MTQLLAMLLLVPNSSNAIGLGTRFKAEKPVPSVYCLHVAEGIAIQQIIKKIPREHFQRTLAEFENNPALAFIPEQERKEYNNGLIQVMYEAFTDYSFAVVDGEDLKKFLEFGKAAASEKPYNAHLIATAQATSDQADFLRGRKHLRTLLIEAAGIFAFGAVGTQLLLPEASALVALFSGGALGSLAGLGYTFNPSTDLNPKTPSRQSVEGESPLGDWLKAFIDSPQLVSVSPYFNEGDIRVFRKDGPDYKNPKIGAKFLFYKSE